MPNYDYRCDQCNHVFEVFQKMSDPKLEDCPQDGCPGKVKRLLGTGAGVIFKGTGFYQTDYRSDSYKKGASSDGGAKSKPAPAKDKGAKGGGHSCGSGCGC
ncbi:MAG: zinc ribbon domain-containing protein [Akkermansiaceae bacterium]|nr:zinc ribbon domain-containing protein [Akkermansiaceae bacterium]